MRNRRSWILAGLVAAAAIAGAAAAGPMVASADSPRQSPLEAFPGFRVVKAELDENAFEREDRARQNLVRECMAGQGLQYEPVQSVTVDSSELDEAWPEDPNEAYAAGLPDGQREEYYLALYGMEDPNAPDQPALGGCLGAAHARIPGVFALRSELGEALFEARQESAGDSQVLIAERTWADCMARGGFDFESEAELRAADDAGFTEAADALRLNENSCATGLANARETARIAAEEQFLVDHRGELEEFRRSWEAEQELVRRYQ